MLLGTKDNRDFLCELDIATMHVFLAMKIGMIQKFLYFLCFEEHSKKKIMQLLQLMKLFYLVLIDQIVKFHLC